jgi:hypothetical protein
MRASAQPQVKSMSAKAFPRPLTVLVGLGFHRRVATVLDACAPLDGTPEHAHDEAFDAVMVTCRMAMAGTASIEEANDVFAAYARRTGIFVDDHVVEFAEDMQALAA